MMRSIAVLLAGLLALSLGQHAAPRPRRPPSLALFKQGTARHSFGARASSAIFHPSAFGADPTGKNDSTLALQAAINAALDVAVPGAHFIGNASDAGGATVDLEGGEYRVSSPLWLRHGAGGVRICCGSLLADPAFPNGQFLVNTEGGSEDITVEDVAFECGRRGGAVATSGTLRVHLARLYVAHFVGGPGVRISQGHEVHVTDSFLGEFLWGEPGSGTGTSGSNLTGTAIDIDGQDHWISDVIVFSARYGIVLNGGALVLTNTHIYNGGEEGLRIVGAATRVLGCYFDNGDGHAGAARVVAIDPTAVDVWHNMFLGATSIELRSSGKPGAAVAGFHAVHNQFIVGNGVPLSQPWEGVYLNQSAGPFAAVNGTVVDRNANPPQRYGSYLGLSMHLRGTAVRRTLRQKSAKRWRFDVGDALLFPPAVAPLRASFTVEAEAGFPEAVLRPIAASAPANTGTGAGAGSVVVEVESRANFSGAVHLTVWQGDAVESAGTGAAYPISATTG